MLNQPPPGPGGHSSVTFVVDAESGRAITVTTPEGMLLMAILEQLTAIRVGIEELQLVVRERR